MFKQAYDGSKEKPCTIRMTTPQVDDTGASKSSRLLGAEMGRAASCHFVLNSGCSTDKSCSEISIINRLQRKPLQNIESAEV